ncbi:MAG: hypothetical protein AUI14_18880 [Actinobacteria bacterium 13_2_20CM_2_71_6]|nr:MAG: hypothetical protein AUI14_18880 [Actinobacteria bacterium 13_2_20CM_2_71_6]
MPPRTKLAELADIATAQWGMVTTAQAGSVDVSPQAVARLASSGDLERLAHGVYRIAGSPPGPHDEVRAAWLGLDPRRTAGERIAGDTVEVVSHRSAALLHDLGDVDSDILEFSAPTRRQTRRSDIHLHRRTVAGSDWTLVDGLPVTTPLRTISDLAAARLDLGHLAGIVRDALVGHHLSVSSVAEVLDQHAKAYGVAIGGVTLVEVMLDEAGVPESALDVAMYAGPAARRSLVDRLVVDGAFGHVARRNLEALEADGTLEAIAVAVLRLAADPTVQLATRRSTTNADSTPEQRRD